MPIGTLKSALRRGVKYAVIRGGLEAIALPGVGRWMPRAAGRGVIFTLHHVRPDPGHEFDPNGLLSITPDFLDVAIRTARAAGLHPVALSDLPELLAGADDGRRFVAFTLDDGYRDNARFAAPVFREHGVPYTIFVTPGFVMRERSMWWETAEALLRQVPALEFDFGSGPERVAAGTTAQKHAAFDRLAHFVATVDEDDAVAAIDAAARAAGIDPPAIVDREILTIEELGEVALDPLAHLGAHTMTHPNLARVTPERLADEIGRSARLVAGYAGRTPRAFAFPYGFPAACGAREARAAAEAGFGVAVTTQPGVLDPQALARPTYLPRVSLNGRFQKARFVRALISGIPFRLMG